MKKSGVALALLGLLFATPSDGVRVEAEVLDEMQTIVKDNFSVRQNPTGVAAIFDMMSVRDATDAGCGTALEMKVIVSGEFGTELATMAENHFSLCVDGVSLCAKGSGWQDMSTVITEGRRVVSINGVANGNWSFAEVETAINSSSSFDVSFDVGFDLTSCWNGVSDMEDHPVCGKFRYSGLAKALKGIAESDNAEEALREIAHFNLRVISAGELLRLRTPAITGLFSDNNLTDQSCFRSALTPICAVVASQGKSGEVYWLAERKLELVGELKPVNYWPTDPMEEMSLAGPESSFRTSIFRSRYKWHRRDAGFRRAFKNGFQVEACGSRDATYALQSDANALAKLGMTGYKLQMRFYSPEVASGCGCDPSAARWPLVLNVKADDRTYRVAMSLQNYLNNKIRSWWNVLSDKRRPEYYYERWFVGMWPSYFHLPQFKFDVESNILHTAGEERSNDESSGAQVQAIESSGNIPEEELMKVGDRVMALTSMWWDGSCSYCDNEKVVIEHQYRDGFPVQVYQTKLGKAPWRLMGKNYEALAGSMGTIKEVYEYFPIMDGASLEADEAPSFAVEWDHIQVLKKYKHEFMPAPVFRVFPQQVVTVPRRVLLETTTTTTTTSEANETDDREPNGGDGGSGAGDRRPLVVTLAALGLVAHLH